MKPLYDARVGDVLEATGAAVVATCSKCQRAAYVPRAVLVKLPKRQRVTELEKRLRCDCGHRGGTVWVHWPNPEPSGLNTC